MIPDAVVSPETLMVAGVSVVHAGAFIAIAFVLAGFLCATVRLIKGPSLPDRVVALDLISVLMVCFIGAFAIVAEEPAFLDAAIALALVAFLATVAFARYAESQAERDGVQVRHTEHSGEQPESRPVKEGGP